MCKPEAARLNMLRRGISSLARLGAPLEQSLSAPICSSVGNGPLASTSFADLTSFVTKRGKCWAKPVDLVHLPHCASRNTPSIHRRSGVIPGVPLSPALAVEATLIPSTASCT